MYVSPVYKEKDKQTYREKGREIESDIEKKRPGKTCICSCAVCPDAAAVPIYT
jgi:hypothetical protein